ncbi:MAG: glycosyltransferase [Actinomycetota bacterium]
MDIEVIGTRGWSYAGHEDLIRELGPRFVRDGDTFTIHAWATEETIAKGITSDVIDGGVRRIFHSTREGKFSGQFFIAWKSSWAAARSNCDVIYCAFIQNGIYMWLPRLFGKRVLSNVDGMMWRDPKWPWGFRQVFFTVGAYLTRLFSNKTITDSIHMQELYRRKFHLNLDWAGYGCSAELEPKRDIDLAQEYPEGYYLIMSRITPHNLTDLLVEGFIKSGSPRQLLIAGHLPESDWFESLQQMAAGKRVRFLGLIKDQEYLTQVILNSRAYLHGHSLGGINPALVRVTGLSVPVMCIDTIFNREVVEAPNHRLQAICFNRNSDDVARAIREFEQNEAHRVAEAQSLGTKVRQTMSWDRIYDQYRTLLEGVAPRNRPGRAIRRRDNARSVRPATSEYDPRRLQQDP